MKNFAVVVLCLASISTEARHAPEVTKLFHHRGSAVDQIVCYATRQPDIAVTERTQPHNGRQLTKKIFFLPGAQLSTEDAVMVSDQINAHQDPTYRVNVDPASNGIRLSFVYDPKLTTVDHHTFTAISGAPGVVWVVNTPRKRPVAQRDKPLVILDYGHGGSDTGAIGLNGVSEKALTMAIGRQVKKLLQAEGCEVIETRTRDTFVPLDTRTSTANRRVADLFVSLHINSAPRPDAQGIETFFNSAQKYKPNGKLFSKKELDSADLAQELQGAVLGSCKRYTVKDRHAKPTVSQVLMGTEMPSALVELGFCSHPLECKRLSTAEYQQQLAKGVAQGVVNYLTAR